MGHRMELYINPKEVNEIINISNSFGVDAKIVGRVEKSNSKKLTIKSSKGEFNYF
jgi:phosphoribosylformylglycinamidine cyclo-ligase